mgnify:CR=1 FL=1
MTLFKDEQIESIVQKVLDELKGHEASETQLQPDVNIEEPEAGDTKEYSDITEYSLFEKTFIRKPLDEEYLARLKRMTPARIGLGRTGPRYLTIPWLRFKADHASAMDIYRRIDADRDSRITLIISHDELPEGLANIVLNGEETDDGAIRSPQTADSSSHHDHLP